MYPEYYKDFHTVRAPKQQANGHILIELESSRAIRQCTECGSWKVYRQQKTTRKYLDITKDGQLIDLVLYGHRYQCQNCQKTFSDWPESMPERNEKVSDDVVEAALQELSDDVLDMEVDTILKEKISASHIAKQYGISSRAVSSALRRKTEEAKNSIMNYIECEELFFIPETYRRKRICVIGGITKKTRKKVLLDIVESYDEAMVHQTVAKCSEYACEVAVVHAAMDRSILDTLHASFSQAIVVVLIDCIRRLMNSSNTYVDGFYNKRCNALNALSDIINTSNTANFKESFNEWWNGLDEEVREPFIFLHSMIQKDMEEIEWALNYKETEKAFKDDLSFLSICQKNNMDYEVMRYYVLLRSHTVFNNAEYCEICFPYVVVGGFYIDLDELNEKVRRL